jgi:Abortive infection alpha
VLGNLVSAILSYDSKLAGLWRYQMAKERKRPISALKIEASARASVGANYSITKKVTEIIPEDVTRATAASWLDMISPLTEWAGLKGDQLRLKRDILRLQREETLTRIASIISSKPIVNLGNPRIPTKFIVNYLEKASLEEPDSSLVELWANLLISAAENYNPRQLHFANIISQLSSQQAKIFGDLIGTDDKKLLEIAHDNILMWINVRSIRSYLSDQIGKNLHKRSDDPGNSAEIIDEFCDIFAAALDRVGVTVVYGSVAPSNDIAESLYQVDFGWTSEDDKNSIDYDILVTLGLADRVETGTMLIQGFDLELIFYHITAIGVSFAEACGIVS